MRRHLSLPTALLALALAATASGAQQQRFYPRPELPRGSDPNDWETYYDRGVELLNRGVEGEAEAAFYWAARVNPTRAEPPYGIRIAIFMQDIGRWQRYLDDSPQVMRHPDIVRADSLLREAFVRNPFVPRTLDVLVVDQLPGRWRQDRGTQAWLHYARGNTEQAARLFARQVEENPRAFRERYDLALALVGLGRMDSAAVQVQAIIDELRHRDDTRLVTVYESKDLLEYALGLLHLARRRLPEARAAMERAAVENAAAFTAHRGLGAVAMAEGKPAEAAGHYAQAAELAGEHPLIAYEHGRALAAAGRPAEAVPRLARAAALEPHWADAHLELARAHDRAGSPTEAVKSYERYLALAPRKAATTVQTVRQRVEQLRAGAGPTGG